MTISYLNDKKLKADMIAEMTMHQKQDDLIKGTYSYMNGRFKGCAVGCGVQSLNIKRGLSIKHDDHAAYANAIGIPEWLAILEDTLFEGLPEKEAKKFPLKFIKAIPVGVDLEPIKWRFCAFILKENIEIVLTLKIKDELKQQVVEAIQGVLRLHKSAVKTGQWDSSAESAAWSAARSAARSAAWSAARSAAWSAAWSARSAESAAWSAARSAARSAESAAWSAAWSAESAGSAAWSAARSAESAVYSKYARELLRLLKKAK